MQQQHDQREQSTAQGGMAALRRQQQARKAAARRTKPAPKHKKDEQDIAATAAAPPNPPAADAVETQYAEPEQGSGEQKADTGAPPLPEPTPKGVSGRAGRRETTQRAKGPGGKSKANTADAALKAASDLAFGAVAGARKVERRVNDMIVALRTAQDAGVPDELLAAAIVAAEYQAKGQYRFPAEVWREVGLTPPTS